MGLPDGSGWLLDLVKLAAPFVAVATLAVLLWKLGERLFAPTARQAARAAVTYHETTFDDAVIASARRRAPEWKAWLEGTDMFGLEIEARNEAARVAHDTAAQLQALHRTITPLAEIPLQVGRLADAVGRFEGAIEKLGVESKVHGEHLAEMRGELKAWTGPERRRGERRTGGGD